MRLTASQLQLCARQLRANETKTLNENQRLRYQYIQLCAKGGYSRVYGCRAQEIARRKANTSARASVSAVALQRQGPARSDDARARLRTLN